MNKVTREEWTAALRSGRYEQGVEWLERTDGEGTVRHCCLGVLCDMVGYERDHTDGEATAFVIGREVCNTTVPQCLAGMEVQLYVLMGMNDRGSSFKEIADWIDTHIEELKWATSQ